MILRHASSGTHHGIHVILRVAAVVIFPRYNLDSGLRSGWIWKSRYGGQLGALVIGGRVFRALPVANILQIPWSVLDRLCTYITSSS